MHSKNLPRYRGFSLVEVMVGMVMGLIVLLVIMKAFALAEGYKRTTTSGADSQVNGLLALRTLEAEIRMAGYGLTGNGANFCSQGINMIDKNGLGGSTASHFDNMPITLIDGGAGSDAIEVVYSNSNYGASPLTITVDMPVTSNKTVVNDPSLVNDCDLIIYVSKDDSKACTVAQVTDTHGHAGGPATSEFLLTGSTSNYNLPGGGNRTFFPNPTYTTGDYIINLGSFADRKYSVVKPVSTKNEYFLRNTNMRGVTSGTCTGTVDPNKDQDAISNIVYLKAQYGVALAASQQVSCWTSAATTDTGCGITAGSNWSAPTATDVKRIKAIRYVVVARSQLPEKPNADGTCSTTASAPISWQALGTGTPPTINLSGLGSDWQCYRYKTYQTIVPMINVIWSHT